ncbi:carboxypeptidase-like regulatory domain-containing protein [Nocardioides sp. Soil805]|uniref:carboxypeptidase-like regulatory domain-containing protein n=1 Tax=Nocardioides sp. Soil805 TaxID=1736416 RepID=UPI0007039B99|nr:carboxypeptidase-like regulatory domain-containing protein [Nocardioides sp. Soil805]KRF34650.1 hypothetical protein ASG94_10735 [Nocardioides sp. Soil805]
MNRITATTTGLATVVALAVAPLAMTTTAAHGADGTAGAVAGYGSIAGTVTDDADAPLAGVDVSVLRNFGYGDEVVGQAETDSTGAYRIDDVEAYAYYKLRFTDPDSDFATEYYDDVIAGPVATWVPVTADEVTAGTDASLEAAGRITGRLTVGAGAPVPNGQVSLWWQYGPSAYVSVDTYVTDQDGRFALEGVKGATYALGFRDPSTGASEFWDEGADLFSATPLVVETGQERTGIDVRLGGLVQNTSAPTISGVAQVGTPLTAGPGTWQPAGTTVTYRWVVGDDTTPADDPTGPAYTPTAADLGKSIRVLATGTHTAGWVPSSAWSAATAPVIAAPVPPVVVVPPAAMDNVVVPRIKGTLRVGRVLRVTAGSWTPDPATLTYTWYARGKVIKKATHRRFRVTEKQLGKRLRVTVTAAAPGHLPLSVKTARTARIRR